MKILYLHGWGSGPGAYKAKLLAARGHEVTTPDLGADDFDRSVAIAQRAFEESSPEVVVGSSRGGAVAMNLPSAGSSRLVLIAPAWKRWGHALSVPRSTIILHSPNDDVVPIAWSRELIEQSGLPHEALIEVGSGHTMTDEAALEALYEAIERRPDA